VTIKKVKLSRSHHLRGRGREGIFKNNKTFVHFVLLQKTTQNPSQVLCIPLSVQSDKQGSHSGMSEDSDLFECEAVSTGKDRRFEETKSLPL